MDNGQLVRREGEHQDALTMGRPGKQRASCKACRRRTEFDCTRHGQAISRCGCHGGAWKPVVGMIRVLELGGDVRATVVSLETLLNLDFLRAWAARPGFAGFGLRGTTLVCRLGGEAVDVAALSDAFGLELPMAEEAVAP